MMAARCSRRWFLAAGAGAVAAGSLPAWDFPTSRGGIATPVLIDQSLHEFAALRRHALQQGLAPIAVGHDAGAVAMLLDRMWRQDQFAVGGLTTPATWFIIETIGRRHGLGPAAPAGVSGTGWHQAAAMHGGAPMMRAWWLEPAI